MHPTRLSDLSEGELLRRLFPVYDTAKGGPADVVLGPGDDAAVLAAPSGAVVLTTDTMVRGRDWLDTWSSPQEVGHKAVCLLYTSPSPRDGLLSRMPSSA